MQTVRPRVLGLCVVVLALLAGVISARADVTMPVIFRDNMLLQRGTNTTVWGWAASYQDVEVDFQGEQGQTLYTVADENGNWSVKLGNLTATTNRHTLVITESGLSVTLTNIIIGDVWICSGQSNMDMGMYGVSNNALELADAEYPDIRLFKVRPVSTGIAAAVNVQFVPLNTGNTNESWTPCRSAAANVFTAVGFSFARDVYKTNGIPLGLIQASVPATGLDQWVNPLAWDADPRFGATNTFSDTNYFNGSLGPITRFAIKGALWYQGEAEGDANDSVQWAYRYRDMLDVLVKSWRAEFASAGVDFPFIAVQLHNFANIQPTKAWDELRNSQSTLLLTNNAALVVGVDVGDALNLHPANKVPLGRRAALAARAIAYGETNLIYQGPVLVSQQIAGTNVTLTFSNVGTGLTIRGGSSELKGFTLSGAETNFFNVRAVIIASNQVLLNHPRVAAPAGVRYAWAFNPQEANLGNSADLPANEFRTDSFGLFSGGPNKLTYWPFSGDPNRVTNRSGAVFRGNAERTGVYADAAPTLLTNRIWRFDAGNKVRGTPALQNGMVVFSANSTNIHAVSAATGSEVWRFNAGTSSYGFNLAGDFNMAPAIADGVVLAPMKDYVIALDLADGKYRYGYKAQAYNNADDRIGSPVVVDDTFIFGGGGRFFALEPLSGNRRAYRNLHYARLSPGFTRCSPSISKGQAYFTEPTFFSINLSNNVMTGYTEGSTITNTAAGDLVPCAALADGAAIVARSNVVQSINLSTRVTNWTFVAANLFESSPALYHGVVYVGNNDGNLYALDSATGASNWTLATGGAIKSSPAVANGLIFFGSLDGKVYSVNPGGALVSSYQTGGPVYSSPVPSAGAIFVGSDDGYLYALAGDDTTLPALEAAAATTGTVITLRFNEPMQAPTVNATGNYGLSGGVSVTNAELADDQVTVILRVTAMTANQPYMLTVSNLTDLAGNSVAAGTQVTVTYTEVIPTYSVTYAGNGHTGGNPPSDTNLYQAGQSVTVLGNVSNLVKTGYSFLQWNTEANGAGLNYTGGASFVMSASNISLYAKWLSNSTPTLVVYEGFDITPGFGALAGSGGATSYGWTNNWTAGVTNNVLATGLTHTNSGKVLATKGGAAQLSYGTGSFRNFAPAYSTGTGTYWISFLGVIPSNATSWCGLSLFNAYGNELLFLGDLTGATNWGAQTYGTGGMIRTSNVPVSVQVFMVARIDFNVSGNLDNTLVWINPMLGDTPPSDASADFTMLGVDFSGSGNAANIMRFRMQQGIASGTVFDEIRMGKTWADVAPYTIDASSADTDGDGMSDYEEFIADTEATNNASYFKVGQIAHTALLDVTVAGRSNRAYHLWRTTNGAASNPVWEKIAASATLASHSIVNLSDTNPATGNTAWYKLEVTLP